LLSVHKSLVERGLNHTLQQSTEKATARRKTIRALENQRGGSEKLGNLRPELMVFTSLDEVPAMLVFWRWMVSGIRRRPGDSFPPALVIGLAVFIQLLVSRKVLCVKMAPSFGPNSFSPSNSLI